MSAQKSASTKYLPEGLTKIELITAFKDGVVKIAALTADLKEAREQFRNMAASHGKLIHNYSKVQEENEALRAALRHVTEQLVRYENSGIVPPSSPVLTPLPDL